MGLALVAAVTAVLAGLILPPGEPPGPARVLVTDFGARGDDTADDTAAVQDAMDALRPGDTLVLGPGTFRHADVVTLRVPGVTLTGEGGRLLATREERSAVHIDADRVVVDGVTFAIEGTSRRWFAYEQMKVRVSGHAGVVLRDVVVEGSAAAGIYVGDGASDFLIERASVRHTRADGIHMTGGARNGRVIAPTTMRTGDDGVAVVSYASDPRACSAITVSSPRVLGTTWGRGLSVVGGEDITYSDVFVEDTDAAAVYIAVEGDPYFTRAVRGVRVIGGHLLRANRNPEIDHGAVVVYLGRPEYEVRSVTIGNLLVEETRLSASSTVTVRSAGAPPERLEFARLRIQGGPATAYGGDVDRTAYRVTG